jgi:acetolactate synthase-1/2/3 large subunit
MEECDVCLAVGTRFSAVATDEWSVQLPPQLIRIDADSNRLNENYPAAVGITADAKRALAMLNEILCAGEEGPGGSETWLPSCGDSVPDPAAGALLQKIREALPADSIICWDSLISLWAATRFQALEPRTFLLSSGLCTLGYALPAAIGAQTALPDRRVVAVTGDGAFLFTLSELATLAEENLPVTIFLLDDGGYRAIRNSQERFYGGRTIACKLRNPDFIRLAESFGIEANRLSDIQDVVSALSERPEGPRLLVLNQALASP